MRPRERRREVIVEVTTAAAVGRLSCDASITHIQLDGKLLPVGIGRMKRQLSKREMRALRDLHPRCVRPGCLRPASQCEATT